MKIKDIAREHDLDTEMLEQFAVNSGNFSLSNSVMGYLVVQDDEIEKLIHDYEFSLNASIDEIKNLEREAREEEEKLEIKEKIKNEELSKILITSGFNFDGYTVSKYSGYISGDDVVQVDRGRQGLLHNATDVGESLMGNLSVIRRNALKELKEQAYALGCNAIIGVDFDYLTLDPETVGPTGGTMYMPYVFGVTANGNAVIIEKNQ